MREAIRIAVPSCDGRIAVGLDSVAPIAEGKLMTLHEIPRASISRWKAVFKPTDATGRRLPARMMQMDFGLRFDQPIYRYMSANRLLRILQTRELYLAAVERWPDPFERGWVEQLFRPGAPLDEVRAFGLCFTTRSADEPYWRLYESRCENPECPPADPPVRIETTPMRLTNQIGPLLRGLAAKVFISKVQYATRKAIDRYVDGLQAEPADVAREAAHALSYKRSQFTFEREVRLLWIGRADKDPTCRQLPIDPNELISDVMIGPMVERGPWRDAVKSLKARLKAAGYAGSVRRSLIYNDRYGRPAKKAMQSL